MKEKDKEMIELVKDSYKDYEPITKEEALRRILAVKLKAYSDDEEEGGGSKSKKLKRRK